MVNRSKFDQGRIYREIERNGQTYTIYAASTKHTIYAEYGIVNVGHGHSFTVPGGRTFEGYTDDPFWVKHYEEMWAETNR